MFSAANTPFSLGKQAQRRAEAVRAEADAAAGEALALNDQFHSGLGGPPTAGGDRDHLATAWCAKTVRCARAVRHHGSHRKSSLSIMTRAASQQGPWARRPT